MCAQMGRMSGQRRLWNTGQTRRSRSQCKRRYKSTTIENAVWPKISLGRNHRHMWCTKKLEILKRLAQRRLAITLFHSDRIVKLPAQVRRLSLYTPVYCSG